VTGVRLTLGVRLARAIATVAFAVGVGSSASADPPSATAPEATPSVSAAAGPRSERYAVWVSIPSLDGAAGAELGGELRVRPRLAVVVAAGARRSASGDYDGLTAGAGAGVRWYWRGHGGWRQPAGTDRVGWFTGGRIEAARTSLEMAGRSLGSTWQFGGAVELGYRLTPWRGLAITGLVTLDQRLEVGGGLPAWRRGSIGVGLEVGWMF